MCAAICLMAFSKQSILLLLVGCRLSIREEELLPLEPLRASWRSLRRDRFLLEAEHCCCECSSLWLDWLADVLLLLALEEKDEDNDGVNVSRPVVFEIAFSLSCCCLCLIFHVEIFLWILSVNGGYDSP